MKSKRVKFERRQSEAALSQAPFHLAASAVLLGLYLWTSYGFWLVALGVSLLSLLSSLGIALRARAKEQKPSVDAPASTGAWNQGEVREDPHLGRIEWLENYESWCTKTVLDEEEIIVTLDGDRDLGPTEATKALWARLKPQLQRSWSDVIAYFVRFARERGSEVAGDSDVRVTGLSLGDGEIAFEFEVAGDLNGSWCVSMADGKPLSVHRNS